MTFAKENIHSRATKHVNTEVAKQGSSTAAGSVLGLSVSGVKSFSIGGKLSSVAIIWLGSSTDTHWTPLAIENTAVANSCALSVTRSRILEPY